MYFTGFDLCPQWHGLLAGYEAMVAEAERIG